MDRVKTCAHCGNVFYFTSISGATKAMYCSLECAVVSRTNIVEGDGCWEWTAGLDPHGYPQLAFRLRGPGALKGHRMALELALERQLTPSECALHTCDNRKCMRVGDGHIRLGTRSENIVECHAKGRGSRPPRPSQALTPEQHAEIARRRAAGEEALSIARDMGIARHTVYQSRRRVRAQAGVSRRNWKIEEIMPRILELTAAGKSKLAIAKEIGVCWATVDRALKAAA